MSNEELDYQCSDPGCLNQGCKGDCEKTEDKMKEFRFNFTKTVHGFAIIKAKKKEEAKKKLLAGEIDDEWDNKSDYIFDDEVYEEFQK